MSKETPVTEEQLFDSDDSEVAEDDATDSEVETEEATEEEQEQGLDLEEENKAPVTKARDSKFEQLEAFQNKIKLGKISSPEDLPAAQKWMADYLKFPDSTPKLDIDELREKIAEDVIKKQLDEREAADFEKLREELEEKADKSQKAEIRERFLELRADKMPKLKALKLAAELAKVDFDGIAKRKSAMRIPTPGKIKGRSADLNSMSFDKIAERLSPAEQVKYLESLQ